jgi:hypothetical protein
MWIVRRITSVLTSTAGLRDASACVLSGCDGRRAKAARPPATSAVAAASAREYLFFI